MGITRTGRGWARGQRMNPEQPMSDDKAAARALATVARAYMNDRATKREVNDAIEEWQNASDPLVPRE